MQSGWWWFPLLALVATFTFVSGVASFPGVGFFLGLLVFFVLLAIRRRYDPLHWRKNHVSDGPDPLVAASNVGLAERNPLTAVHGDAQAQFNLGFIYARGQGVPQDYVEAAKWFRLAAAQGFPGAQFNLGVLYDEGRGVLQDYTEAMNLYLLAAAQGNADAQYNVAAMYSNGRGVPKNYVQAHMWLNLAAAQGDVSAVKARDSIAAQMTPAQITEAQRLAREWKPTPAR